MKVRIEGLPDEVAALAAILRARLEVVEESRNYPNRGDSELVRRYLEIRTPARPDEGAPRPGRIVRARRLT